MHITALIRHSHYVLFALILCAIAASSCSAVSMDVEAGFHGVIKAWVWTPIAVKLDNTDSNSVSGVLTITNNDPNRTPMPVCTAQVELPANSRKLYYIYTRMSTYSGNMKVTLSSRFGNVAEKQIQVNPVADTDKLLLLVGEKSTQLSYLTGEKVKAPPATVAYYQNNAGPTDADVRVGSIENNALPDKVAAYDAVDVMVISNLNAASTKSDSLAAISSWVASGGTLVVSAGANYRIYQNDFYDDLLPVSISGAANLPGLGSLSRLGDAPFPAGAVTVAQSSLKPGIGRAVVSEAGMPIIAERDYGLGKVIFLAFDYASAPFNAWNGQVMFWKSLLSDTYPTQFVGSTAGLLYKDTSQYNHNINNVLSEADLASVVAQQTAVKAPSSSVIGLFLLAYLIVLVPVNYLFLKKKNRMEMVWISTPVIVVAFTLGAYAIGYTMKGGRVQMHEARIIQGSSDSRYASVISDCSLFSPRRHTYEVNINGVSALGQALSTDESENLSAVSTAKNTVLNNVTMPMWSTKTFEAVGGIDLGGKLESNLTLRGNTLQGTLTNNTNLRLEGCRVVYGETCSPIGVINKGRSASVNLNYTPSNGSALSRQNYYTGYDAITPKLVDMVGARSHFADGPVLLAKVVSDEHTFEVAGSNEEVASYCAFKLNIKSGGAFKLDSSLIKGRIAECSNAGMFENGSVYTRNIVDGKTGIRYRAGGYTMIVYQVPVPSNGVVTSLVLDTAAAGVPPSALNGFNRQMFNYSTGSWDSFNTASFNADPARYLSPGNEVKVKIKFARGGEGSILVGLSAAGKQR